MPTAYPLARSAHLLGPADRIRGAGLLLTELEQPTQAHVIGTKRRQLTGKAFVHTSQSAVARPARRHCCRVSEVVTSCWGTARIAVISILIYTRRCA
jgi:hypothetical protein